MENEFDYYIAEYQSSLFARFTDKETIDKIIENRGTIIELERINMSLYKPYRRKSIMLDFLELNVVSEKVYEVLSPMKVKGMQLIPVTIYNSDNKKTYDKFYYLHVYNRLECIDKNNSIYHYDIDHGFCDIKKIILKDDKLSKVPLDERLIFKSLEPILLKNLFHKSVVDKLLAAEPKGIRFVNIKDHKGS
jgi:hypothetical protein